MYFGFDGVFWKGFYKNLANSKNAEIAGLKSGSNQSCMFELMRLQSNFKHRRVKKYASIFIIIVTG